MKWYIIKAYDNETGEWHELERFKETKKIQAQEFINKVRNTFQTNRYRMIEEGVSVEH